MDGLRLLGPGTLAAIVDYTAAERLRLVEDARPPELDTADLWGRIFEGPPSNLRLDDHCRSTDTCRRKTRYLLADTCLWVEPIEPGFWAAIRSVKCTVRGKLDAFDVRVGICNWRHFGELGCGRV
jgi:hypothetical protein